MPDRATEEGNAAASRGGGLWRRWGVLGAVCAAVIGVYAWAAHPGFLESSAPGANESYYNLLVRAFRDGRLNVERDAPNGPAQPGETAPPGTEAHPPNDPLRELNRNLDLSYYKGKLYLFFGATPALVLFWPYAALTGHYLLHKDAAVIFFSVGFLAGAGLLRAVWRRYFRETNFGVVAAGTLALGLANLAPAILGRSDVYEVAVSCGYAMTMLALAGVWAALHDARRRGRWLAAASLAYGLAVGARPGLLPGAVILLVPVAQGWRERRREWRLLVAAGGPIALIGAGMMVYNALRFGSPFEFGQRYQLPLTTHHQFSPLYLWFNFRVGFLEVAHWSARFPFATDIREPMKPSGYFAVDHAFGVLTNIPLVWLALAAPLAWRGQSGEGRSILRWFLGAVAALFGISALILCLHDSMCLRYELEFAFPLVFLAAVGMLALERALAGEPAWRRAARCGWGMLLVFSSAFNLLANSDLQADVHVGRGVVLLQSGQLDEAIQQYQTALRLDPGYAEAHYDLGCALAGKGDLAGAIAQFRTGLASKPHDAQTHHHLALALSATGDVNGAIEQYAEALAIQPNLVEARQGLGAALLQKGDLDGAIACYQQTTAMNPDLDLGWYDLGSALLQKGDLDRGIASLRHAIQLNPRSAESYGNLGAGLFENGEAQAAMEAWQRALEIQPDQTNALLNFAWALATTPDAALRDGARAVAFAERAEQLTGRGNPAIDRTLAAAYAETGNYAQAATTARHALELALGQKNGALAAALQKEIQLYEAGQPAREIPTRGAGTAPPRGKPPPSRPTPPDAPQ